MDAVQKVGNGHPGTAMSLAPAAYLLYQRILRHDPADPQWPGRDRFVLSCGHSSLTLYIQLYLSGYALSLDDLKALRTWGSITPGHPEYGLTPGVEVTTGPLGQGIGNAVGMAMAARRERGLFDPDAAPGTSPFDHFVYAFCSDGDIEEGISHESSSIAAVQELGNLIVMYDDNYISIEDNTRIAKSEDVGARYEAYGWHVQHVDWHTADGGYHENVQALYDAFEAAKAVTDKPSFIVLHTIIGWPAPTKKDTGAAHGSALGAPEVAATKEILGFDPAVNFPVEEEALARAREVAERGKALHAAWDEQFKSWEKQSSERSALYARMATHSLPGGVDGRAAGVPGRPEGHRHPQGLGRGAVRARAGAAGAVGRLGRPGRVQPHHDEGRAVLPPQQPPDADVAGRPVRPDAALRHPRARHGLDPQRHRRARRHPRLRRDVPSVQRLHARRRATGGADGDPGHLRLDARLGRPRRGRPDAPADRAPVVAAEHPAPRRGAPGRRQRDRGRLAGDPGADRPARGPVPEQAERADVRPGDLRAGRRRGDAAPT